MQVRKVSRQPDGLTNLVEELIEYSLLGLCYHSYMIKALIFDCFGVFYTDPVFAYMHDPKTPSEKANTLHELDEQAARGKLSKSSFVEQVSQLLKRPAEEIEQQFFRSEDRNQELVNFIQELRKDYKVALLSNIGADMMDGFFTPDERKELFDVAILSGAVGYAKPDPEIFRLACTKLGVLPTETVMIDDVQNNVDTAKGLGMQGIHYENFAQFKLNLDVITNRMNVYTKSLDSIPSVQS